MLVINAIIKPEICECSQVTQSNRKISDFTCEAAPLSAYSNSIGSEPDKRPKQLTSVIPLLPLKQQMPAEKQIRVKHEIK